MKLNPFELANTISMGNKRALLVEGETDARFWKRVLCNAENARIIYVANGKKGEYTNKRIYDTDHKYIEFS